MKKITIDRRHMGPFGNANGEYIARILSEALRGAPVTVRILRPVPVDTPIYLYRRGNTAFIRHNDRTVATAEVATELEAYEPVTRSAAVGPSLRRVS